MKRVLFLIYIGCSVAALGQSQCFESCFSDFEKAKSHSLKFNPEINDMILQALVGCKAPEFSVETVSGKRIKLSGLRGKVVVLNFWFIGCAPCIAELPALNRLVDDYDGKDVVFVAFGRDDDVEIREFLEKKEFKYHVVTSDRKLEKEYCILGGWPTSMVLDKDGVLRKIFTGGYTNEKALTHAYDEMKPVIDDSLKK